MSVCIATCSGEVVLVPRQHYVANMREREREREGEGGRERNCSILTNPTTVSSAASLLCSMQPQ